jgi:2'-hydroxyisoflavone reductase
MRLLILGGTVFLGRATAAAALAAGDDVTCAARGQSGEVPAGARTVTIDRDDPATYAAIEGTYDAVVDVSSRPSHVRGALAALAGRTGHRVYVSSGSVYTDDATPGQRPATAPTHEAAPPEVDDPFSDGFANYGPCKVTCEQAVRAALDPGHAFVCRAGLIVGPEDRSDRFTYWPERLARGGEVLAPGTPDDLVQWIDVRDLGAWLARAGRECIGGTYDGVGVPVGRGEFLAGVAAGAGVAEPTFTWVPDAFLVEQGVNAWAGPKSLPLWLPGPDNAGFLAHDGAPAIAAGLASRPLAETALDTLRWAAGRPPLTERKSGLSADDEAAVLAAWHAQRS